MTGLCRTAHPNVDRLLLHMFSGSCSGLRRTPRFSRRPQNNPKAFAEVGLAFCQLSASRTNAGKLSHGEAAMVATRLLASFPPSKVALWSGAGISCGAPANLPLGGTLTKAVVDYSCLPGTWDIVVGYLQAACLTDSSGQSKTIPRLEAVLDSLYSVIGIDAFPPLSGCGSAPPNVLHTAAARHILGGGFHVTTNFDQCIEKCLPRTHHQNVLHLHGIYESSSLPRLGARISTIASGLPLAIDEQLLLILGRSQAIVFLGYSGSDYFDVNPFFRSLRHRGVDLKHLSVIWLSHGPNQPSSRSWDSRSQGAPILSSSQNCGATVIYLQGDAGILLSELVSAWFLPPVTGSSSTSGPAPHCPLLSPDRKMIATAQLFSSMGIGKEQVAIAPQLETLVGAYGHGSPEWIKGHLLLNDGYRNIGRYGDAHKYSKAIAASSDISRVTSHHRQAGDCWLQGRHLRACRHFAISEHLARRAMRSTPRSGEELELVKREYTELEITKLHWLRDLSKQAGPAAAAVRTRALSTLERMLARRHEFIDSPHAQTKLLRLYTELGAADHGVPYPSDIEGRYPSLRDAYHETDSLLGVANFLRREIYANIAGGGTIGRDRLDHLYELSQLIGDRPGILKAALLRRALLDEDTPGIMDVLEDIQWGYWYRRLWLRRWTNRQVWG